MCNPSTVDVRAPGAVLLVTHGQDLLEEVATCVWQFEASAIGDFKSNDEELVAPVA